MYQHTAQISAIFILITVLFLYKMKDYQNSIHIINSTTSNETKLLLLKANEIDMNLHDLGKTIVEKFDDTDINKEEKIEKLMKKEKIVIENLQAIIEPEIIESLKAIIERNSATAKQEKWVQHLKDTTFKKVFSQNDEDGALEAVFFHIGVTDKVYVEFGVEDCTECNSRYLR